MKSFGEYAKDLKRAQQELIAHIDREIQRRRNRSAPSRELAEEVIPGDDLIASVGKLALLSDPSLQHLCEQSVWPRVCECLGLDSPGLLTQGSFAPLIEQANSLLAKDVDIRLAARTAVSERRPGPSREKKATSDRELAAHAGEFAEVAPSPWADDCLTLFINRLEAGFFLTGLEVLWPAEGPAAARQIWDSGGLGTLDALLVDYKDRLVPLQKDFQTLLADLPVSLSLPWFSGISALIGQPRLSLYVPEEGAPETEDIDPALLRTALLEEELDPHLRGREWFVAADRDPSLLFVQNVQGAAAGVWFPSMGEEKLILERDSAVYLRTVVRAKVVSMASVEDGEGQVFLLQFEGYIPEETFAASLPGGEDSVVFESAVFTQNHDETLGVLVNMLQEREEA